MLSHHCRARSYLLEPTDYILLFPLLARRKYLPVFIAYLVKVNGISRRLEPVGLEPTTIWLQIKRSIQLELWPQVGEVCSPLRFKEKICLITNNFSDFNDCKQLFLLLIKKCYIYYLSFGAGEGTWTHTLSPRLLGAVCLPIPTRPHIRLIYVLMEPSTTHNFILRNLTKL